MALPWDRVEGEASLRNSAIFSAILKALLWEDRVTGSLISAGATLSFPTASSNAINPGMSTIAYAQPFVGYIANLNNFYVQGFSSITLPIASPQSIVMFNDIGIGYFAYRSNSGQSFLQSVAPTLELHVLTPLTQANPNVNLFGVFDTLKLYNTVDLTLGTTFQFSNRTTLGVGMSAPLTAPKPFDLEGIVQLNYLF